MPLEVVRNDITKMEVDAIVNTASSRPVFGSGTDEAIYLAAGVAKMAAARLTVGAIAPGTAAATEAFGLSNNGVKHVIHAVYWDWIDETEQELETLRGAYRSSLRLALELGCKSLAIPLLGAGNRGYPADLAIDVALSELYGFLHKHEMQIYLVLYSPIAWAQATRLFPHLTAYIDDAYAEGIREAPRRRMEMPSESRAAEPRSRLSAPTREHAPQETLIEMLDRVMEEKHIRPGDIYNITSIRRQVLSKVRNNPEYHLGKSKVIELAIVLRLPPEQADYFLSLADYAFNPSRRRDRIIRKCLADGVFNIFAIDEVLYNAGEELIFSEE